MDARSRMAFLLFALGAVAWPRAGAQADPADSGLLRGTVITADGSLISGAQLRVGADGRHAETGDEGRFGPVRLAVGSQWLHVRRIGYRPDSIGFEIMRGAETELSIRLERVVVEIAPVTVVGRRGISGSLAGFYRRQSIGLGHYFSRAAIGRRAPFSLLDLLRAVPGVRVESRGRTSVVRIGGHRCPPMVRLNGMTIADGEIGLDLWDPGAFEGVEIYNSAVGVPVEFVGNLRQDANCGAVILWSSPGESRAPRRTTGELSAAADIARLLEAHVVYAAADVDSLARLDSASGIVPIYPDSLFGARTSGIVLAEFVLGASGEPDMRTFNVITTTHALFVEPVRRAVRALRYSPAWRNGARVRQILQQPFVFVADSARRDRK